MSFNARDNLLNSMPGTKDCGVLEPDENQKGELKFIYVRFLLPNRNR